MAYCLNEVTMRANNTVEGMNRIAELWQDVVNGKLPILFDSQQNFRQGISPVSRYHHYDDDENGEYDLTIMGVTAEFFQQMERKVSQGFYKKYDENDEKGDIHVCTERAWKKVWSEQNSGMIKRTFEVDYESSVPAEYTKDGKAHCYLYIGVKG